MAAGDQRLGVPSQEGFLFKIAGFAKPKPMVANNHGKYALENLQNNFFRERN